MRMKLPMQSIVPLFTALFILCIGVYKPAYNWDIVGYVASAFHQDGYRGAELSKRTYEDVRNEVDESTFRELVSGNEYRATVFKEPAALEQQLPFYTIRVAYIELVRVSKYVGLSYSKATYVIGAGFAFFSVLLLGCFMVSYGIPILMLPLFVVSAGYVALGRLSSPDSMACFFSLAATWAAVSDRKFSFVVAAFLPLIRTEFLLLSVLLMAYTFFDGKRALSLLSMVAAVLFYALTVTLNGNYGWMTIFNFTLIKLTPYPADSVLSTDINDYLRAYVLAAYYLMLHSHFVIYMSAVYVFFMTEKKIENRKSLFLLLVIPLAFVVLHLALFPDYLERFFVFAASLTFVWVAGYLSSDLLRKA